ncbi:MAG: YfhO family protein [Clostridia bacterium]|nr:YfhO family protein [Clostridia bacterium]
MKQKRNNVLVQLWHSDTILLSAVFALFAALCGFSAFRMLYIQHKLFAAISACIGIVALVFVLFYLGIKRLGGAAKAANRLRENKVVILSLILASAMSLFVFAVYTLSPFGNYTVLRMDLYHQYGPLFAELYDKVREGKSLLYSWNSAGGSGFLGNFFNYLSSPFTLLIFWFSKTEVVTTGISVIIFAKCIASAGTFSYYLKKKSANPSLSISAFALLYAFSAYFIAYYWNVMWLDAMFIFPLIILGIEKIIDHSNAKVYFVALLYTFMTNYYMAYMVCIFSVVYFFVYYLSNYTFGALYVPKTYDMPRFSKIRQSRLLCAGFRFAGASLLAGACCAAVLIPVYKILTASSATKDTFPTDFKLYFDIYDFVAAHLASLEPTIRSSGGDVTPNIYCGIITVLLFPLYLMNKRIGWKEKVLNVILLGGIFLCCNFNGTNFILHGFHYPNDLPYRFSFMYSFILLVCAYKVFRYIREYNYKTMILLGGSLALVVILAQKFDLRYVNKDTIYFSLIFVVVYTLLICASISRKLNTVMTSVVLCCAVVCEVLICDVPKFEFGVQESDYVEDYDEYTKSIEKIKADDSGTYRIELNDIPSELRMSPCWYNYEGINCFSSMASENYSDMQYYLGNFSNKINSFMYHTQTPLYNMMFNIKYVIDNNNPLKLNEQYYRYMRGNRENLTTYENQYATSLGFAVNKEAKHWKTEDSGVSPFEMQSDFMRLATGVKEEFFVPVTLYTDGASGCSITSFENTTSGSMSFSVFESDDETQANFGMNFTADENANYYLYLGSEHDFEHADIKTETYTKTQEMKDNPYVLDLGVLKKGEEVKITTYIDEESTGGSAYVWLVRANDKAIEKAYQALNDGGMLQVERISDTYIQGTFNAGKDEILYTSLTYDSGWKCYVDGMEVKPYQINDSLIALETGEGTHTVEFKFTPAGLKTGLLISGVSIFVIALYFVMKKALIYLIARLTDKIFES